MALLISYLPKCRYVGARQRPKLPHIDIQCEDPLVLQEAGLVVVVVVVYGTGDMETSDNGLNYSWSSQGQGWL